MERAVVSDIADICAPSAPVGAVGAVRPHARTSVRVIRRSFTAALPPPTLRAHRFRPYVSRRPTAVFAGLALLASSMTLLVLVVLPWWIEMAPVGALPSHGPSRITELAVLQRDSLLAAACWPRECVLTKGR